MTTRTARCSCGQLTAVTTAEPVRISVCHCLACQRRTGSVFAAQARFPAGSVTLAGRSHTFARVGDAGSTAVFHFCPICSDTVYYTNDGADDLVAIPVGAFADPSFPAPGYSVYEGRKHGWVRMPADMEHLD